MGTDFCIVERVRLIYFNVINNIFFVFAGDVRKISFAEIGVVTLLIIINYIGNCKGIRSGRFLRKQLMEKQL